MKENELDSYINEEVPALEGDEAKALDKKKLVIAKRFIADSIKDHIVNPKNLSLSSTWPTPPKDTHDQPSYHSIRPPHP